MPDKGSGLIAGGIGLGVGSYFVTALLGAIAIDKGRNADDRDRGKAMMIPIAGPFIAIGKTDSAVRRFGLATSGSMQLAAIGLLIAGAIKHARYKEAKRWSVAAMPTATGGRASLAVRF